MSSGTRRSNEAPAAAAPATPPAPSRGPTWTRPQHDAVTAIGENILVSAAAGSGKTAVLSERCAYLVCDASPRCGVDELLVVTFTDAAAAEMRARIEQTIRRRCASAPSDYLMRQAALVERAQIGTIHGFCARVLREHFHVLGLDPAFRILDADEAALLRLETARNLLADRFDADATHEFERFVDRYGEGDDERIIGKLVRAYEMLRSMVSPDGWRATAQARIDEVAGEPIEASELGKSLEALLLRMIAGLGTRCATSAKRIGQNPQLLPLAEYMQEHLASVLRHWFQVLRDDGIDALAEEARIELPRAPTIRDSVPGAASAKAMLKSIREAMVGEKSRLQQLLAFTSAQWQAGAAAIQSDARIFLDLIPELDRRYTAEKRRSRLVDFADLERLALKLLSDPESETLAPSPIARLYQRQFKHVLVDEYQDVNELQDAIITLVSHELADDPRRLPPNLFCVGDVKQSIYRFRLAEPERFLQRRERYEADPRQTSGRVIHLPDNFRSRGPLLEAINSVFERLMTREAAEIEYDQSHRLVGKLPYPDDPQTSFRGSPLEMHILEAPPRGAEAGDGESPDADFDRIEREAILAARRIRDLVAGGVLVYDKLSDGTLAGRPVRYGDCAILLRAMQYKSEQIASVLRRQGVPVHAESRTGFFEATEVRDVIALLQVLDNQRQDIPLATLLRSPLSGIEHPEDAMATAVLAFRDEREPPPFHVAVARYAREQEDDLAHALRRLFTRLEQWRTDARRRPVAELIWSIYESTGYLTYVTGLDGGEQRRANLLGLHERARQFGEFQRQDLARFLEFLASLETEADLGQPSAASEAEDAVRIMSVHGSKGLEFPVVVLPDLGKQFNLSDTYGSLLFDRHAYLGLQVVDDERLARYPSLPWVIVQERIKAQALAEELRVLYVAMTRAREHLILIGTEGNCDSFETLRELYAQHTGPLPPDAVLGARCYLQWLASAAAALEAAGLRQIDVQEHKRDEINAWTAEMAKAGEKSDFSVQVSSLRPLEPAPPPDAAAAQVIERLRFAYPHETQSRTAAAKSVTSIVKPPELREPVLIPDDGETGEPADLPPLFVEDRPLTAADIGTATHVLMQHLDFARAQQDGGVEAQIDELIARHLLSPRDAAAIDRAGVEWFVRSSLGQELASKEDRLHRELPLYFARPECDPKPADPMDLVMIRGRIDLMLREDDGLTVIDYKTDRVDETTIDARADLYRQQLRLYAEALEAISQQKVKAAKLVFLHARKIVTC